MEHMKILYYACANVFNYFTFSIEHNFFFFFLIMWVGSDDIRAHDAPKSNGSWRSDYSPIIKSIYDEPATASERITGVGYRYLPVHRETYGYSPRAIYSHHYNRPGKYKHTHQSYKQMLFL